ncbi:MAG: flagellar motor switch protein FliG [Xanthomonadaceae bacterium]|jgi:flagellar motor switch protein FliG|nr:flagellar motor switch protein FliG [Xanthomonadaceae bacterium]
MPDTKADDLNGTQRAAVLLMSLGEAEAAEVLKHMSAKEVQKLGAAMATISGVTRGQLEQIVAEFTGLLDEQTSVGIGADDYVRKVLVQALGEDKASGLIDRILHGRNSRGLENLKWMDARAVTELIRNEHPQIMAIVLSYLDPDHAAEVLKFLAERVRSDVMLRIATLDTIPANALNELNDILEKQFSGQQGSKASSVGGLKTAANILNFVDGTLEQQILGSIGEVDNELSGRIQDLMFVFDDIGEMDDRSIQAVLREVPGDRLGLALRGCDPKVREKILKNMSKRAADMLVEDMETRGPAKLSEVEGAQKEMLSIVRRLADSGAIQLGGAGAEKMV